MLNELLKSLIKEVDSVALFDESKSLLDQLVDFNLGDDLLAALVDDETSDDQPFDAYDDNDDDDTALVLPGRCGQPIRGPRKIRHLYKSRFWSYVMMAERDRESLDGIWDEDAYEGSTFRCRFRLPYAIFDRLCREYCETGDDRALFDAKGRPRCDVRLLIMGSLRVLGQALNFDIVEEFTDIAAQTHNAFFKKFVRWTAGSPYQQEVSMPTTEAELRHITEFYWRLGLPGCAGSMDCVHTAWDMCPTPIKIDCTGKEGYPTLVFQVIVSHTRKILA